MSAARRALGPANLLTRPEIAAELGCRVEDVDGLVVGLRRYQVGRWPRWLWSDILARLAADAEHEREQAAQQGPDLRLLPRDDLE